jgi:hypothetical protein
MSTSLTLLDPAGELVQAVDAHSVLYAAGVPDVRYAMACDLAPVMEKLTELKAIVSEAHGLASDRLVALCDQDGCWTRHEGEYTIRTSSPTAGTTGYDVDRLRAVLADLVADDVISAAGANNAVETLHPTASVPYSVLRGLLAVIDGTADEPAVIEAHHHISDLLLDEPEPTYKLKAAGVNALLKLGGEAAEAIAACQVAVEPGRRRAKVTRAAA